MSSGSGGARAVVDIQDSASFKQHVQSSKEHDTLLIAFFWAEFNEASKPGAQMDQLFTNLASRHPDVDFVRVNGEEVEDLAEQFNITSVPAFVFIKKGKHIGTHQGITGAELVQRITSYKNGVVNDEADDKAKLNSRLKKLVNGASVMVFMKGSPSAPRCKFSRALVDILNEKGISYGSFDILQDEPVRQGLKEYSNWPTYPQVYVAGKLVGGLDIIKELKEEGELDEALKPAPSSETTGKESNLNARLEALTKKAPVMVFMKGSPSAPKCGFSSSMVEILKDNGIQFDYFDILSDQSVRQGLKTYSDWPTYPQLYVQGKLVGGLDIIKEMLEDDDEPLAKQLGLEDMNQRLKQLTQMQKVVLFMKGTSEEPKCGFSSRAVDLLREAGCNDFASFDILSDEDVREGLKTYAQWPTYPQLWVDGKLIGGVDILDELQEEGELESLVK
eukprot:gb/GECG01009307.1/.p1 GENE.gb/GECG01009307.1/~~gb/GECG01009307.1/.p1  ORF type:complete len:446 (+),score=75.19 gb/GECG01009307.1/:1-1338(+)